MEKFRHRFFVVMDFKGRDGFQKLFGVREMATEEIQDEVSCLRIIGIIHRNLPKEILQRGIDYGQRAKSVPQVVEHEQPFGTVPRRLIIERYERAAQFDRVRQILFEETRREIEEMGRRQDGFPLGIEPDIGTAEEAVATENLFFLGIPNDELPVRAGHGIEFVDIDSLAGSPAVVAEGGFPEAPDFLHDVGRIFGRGDVDFIVRLVRSTQ